MNPKFQNISNSCGTRFKFKMKQKFQEVHQSYKFNDSQKS